MAKKTPLRVLCLGDSLTAGSPSAHPYGGKLMERLSAAFPSHDVDIEVDGVPGDMVTKGTFVQRMKTRWARQPTGYDWTVVLGGTNDLVWGYPSDAVVEALQKTWDVPLSRGGKVLALTILDSRASVQRLGERRDEVNKAIKAHKRQNFHTFDLFSALPYHGMGPTDREKYWDPDGVHLTEDGYDLMGEKIGEGLIKILHLEEAQSTEISSIVTDARQRRMIEDLIWEEEMGNPKLLSQGYIIVRKRDLD
ncbi:SGNH hydrolase-type esterase domain-containing protein [Xylariales sp. AK1849]|nr:SGNH hydrolase-type esterase domain-containing protein [Xylariales sp. AK1849]